MRFPALFTFLLLSAYSYAQLNVDRLDSATVPKNISYTGHLLQAVQWTDSAGQNIVITSRTGPYRSKKGRNEGYMDASLYACHYFLSGNHPTPTWKLTDFNNECPVDLDLYFIDNTFSVTDLNANGIAEIWLMYKNSCHGDVSPIPMKVIMYEGNKKYALRGTSMVKVSPAGYIGGEYSYDDNFKNADYRLRRYAEKLWIQNKFEQGHK